MPIAHNLGFPHLGGARELKRATEGYWGGKVSLPDLLKTGAELRARHWRVQPDPPFALLPSHDLSFYPRIPDTPALGGALPPRLSRGGGPGGPSPHFSTGTRVPMGGRGRRTV